MQGREVVLLSDYQKAATKIVFGLASIKLYKALLGPKVGKVLVLRPMLRRLRLSAGLERETKIDNKIVVSFVLVVV